MITRDVQFFRHALAELKGDKPSLAWITKYMGAEDLDPVRRAWEACCEPTVMTALLRRMNVKPRVSVQTYGVDYSRFRTDGVDARETYVYVDGKPLPRGPAGYELNHLGLFTVVLPTSCDLIRFLHPAPNLDMFLDGTLSLGDA